MTLFPGLTDKQAQALVDVANAIRTEPQWLYELINFESGHNPQAKNPNSSARGLIQFMDSTAKELGYKGSDDLIARHAKYEDQLRGPVLEYFKRRRPPFFTRQALYMAVFFPIARSVPPETTFKELYEKYPKETGGPDRFLKFKAQNPGIVTVNDYVNKTLARASKKPFLGKAAAGGGAALFLVAALALYLRSRGAGFV